MMARPSIEHTLEDSDLRVIIDSEQGGKVRSLTSLRTGREYLYQDPRTSFSGPGYSDHNVSGLDECFPTVVPCKYPRGRWQGLDLGDHGLLWRHPWKFERSDNEFAATIELVDLPIRFERVCRLIGHGRLGLEYAITNRAEEPIEFLYANHLLLFGDSSTRIEYPAAMDRVFVTVVQFVDGIQEQTWIPWPPPNELGITEPFDPHRGKLIKMFSPQLTTGQFAISHAEKRETLHIEFDAVHLPFLGILLAQGYNPVERDQQGIIIGLEATTGIGDDLNGCRASNTVKQLEPGETCLFQMQFSLRSIL
jgi:hypothetical protein